MSDKHVPENSTSTFLDCGTHFWEGLKDLYREHNMADWHIVSFEPNPTTYKISKENIPYSNIDFRNEAIWTKDGELEMNIEHPPEEGATGMGSSVLSLDVWDPQDGKLRQNFQSTELVKSIDFSEYISQNCRYTHLVVKMDIEGAEYDVLEKMIKDGTMKYVDILYVEFHSKFIVNQPDITEREERIIQAIRTNFHTQLHAWR